MDWSLRPRRRAASGIAHFGAGEGEALVLLHGVGLRAESWLAQVEAFQGEYAVHALDMAGHGESEPLPGSPRLADFSDAVARTLAEIVDGPAWVAGHSMGGLIALDLAWRHPQRVRGVAALNAIYRRAPEVREAVQGRAAALGDDTPLETLTAPVRRWFGDPPGEPDVAAARACTRWLLEGNRAGYAAAYRVFASEDGPPEAALTALASPLLCLTGEHDGNSTPEMSRRMAELAPRGRLCVVHGAGHMAPMTHVSAVNAALRGWLAER